MNRVRSFDWTRAEGGQRQGMQGQNFATILSSANAPGTSACKVIIQMVPGKVSNVHVHYDTDVYVDLIQCGPQGVLTLAGDDLEQEVWLYEHQTLWIPPGVPHVAVYPRGGGDDSVFAVETRTNPSETADVVPLDGFGPRLVARLKALDLYDKVGRTAQML